MSSRKSNLVHFTNIVAGDMSQASITSTVTNIQFLDNIGVQFVWSGSPVGSFAVQVSADYQQDNQGNVTNAGNWIPILLSYWNGTNFINGFSVPTSVGSPIFVDVNQQPAPWIRAVYTKGSGTGTLTGTIVAKMI